MNAGEEEIQEHLACANQIAYRIGRMDVHVAVIAALRVLRLLPPGPPPPRSDDAQFDYELEAANQRVNLKDFLR